MQNRTPPAIVIGLDCMTGLQTARILARRGVPVIGIATDPNHYCCKTNVCERILAANVKSEEFIGTLEHLERGLKQKAVLIPCTDMSVFQISLHRDRLADAYHYSLPSHETVAMLMDKISFYRYAMEKGLPVPQTYFLESRIDAEEASRKLTYPCILKPPMKTDTWERNTSAKVYKAESAQELLELYDRTSGWADILMAQQWIEGSDASLYSCNCYYNANSDALVTFIARKLRQWPPETGTSCMGEEVRNDAVLLASTALFDSVNYQGLGYVEMKRDERSGNHFIIEPNIGRPTGRSAITEAGGVELVYTAYCDMVGLPLPPNREQMYHGVKWISLRRDFQSALHYWMRGKLSLNEWRDSWRGSKGYAIYDQKDQGPFWADIRRVIMLAINEQLKKRKKAAPQPKGIARSLKA